MLPLVIPFFFVAVALTCAGVLGFRLQRLRSQSCSKLLSGMRYVDLREVSRVGRNLPRPGEMDPPTRHELLERLGGTEGLQRLRHNAAAMIEIARFLTLMNPDACEIAHLIRNDAVKVKRAASALYWQQRLDIHLLQLPVSVVGLARSYVAVSRNMLVLCDALVGEIGPLVQEMTNVQARMMRVANAG